MSAVFYSFINFFSNKKNLFLSLCFIFNRLSAASHDPYNEDMRTELLPYDLKFQMFKILSIQTQEEKGMESKFYIIHLIMNYNNLISFTLYLQITVFKKKNCLLLAGSPFRLVLM